MRDALIRALDYWIKGGYLLIPLGVVCLLIWIYFFSLGDKIRKLSFQLEGDTEEVYKKRIHPLEREFIIMEALILSSPLLGLLGTVLGMIETFQAVSFKASGLSQMVGSGISKALLTTQFGLTIALPGTFALSLLRRRYHQLVIKYHIKRIHKIMREKNVKSVS